MYLKSIAIAGFRGLFSAKVGMRHGLVSCIAALYVIFASGTLVGGAEAGSPDPVSTGSIRGKVVYIKDAQRPWRLGRYYIRNSRTGELAEAVVAISKRGLQAPPQQQASSTVTIDQKNFQFSPETVAIRTGDRVRFLNSDEHVHNVRTNHPRKSFNINMPAGVEHVETFSTASGIHKPFKIECVFHSAMRAWVFVFNHPWFAVTGQDGAFELRDIPAGRYQLDVVHAAGDLHLSQPVEVVGGKQTEIEVRLQPTPVNSAPVSTGAKP